MLGYSLSAHALNNETELLSLIAEGDETAFAVLFKYYSNRIYTIAFKITGSATTAEEIVQDVFLIIWLKRADLMDIKNFGAYLFVVTRNNVYKVLKQNSRYYKTTILTNKDQLLMHNDTENGILEKEYDLLLQKAINRLPAQQQKVYKLMKEQGLKRDEVANLLKIDPETIKSHLAQSMRSIRAYCILHSDIHLGIIICLFCHFHE